MTSATRDGRQMVEGAVEAVKIRAKLLHIERVRRVQACKVMLPTDSLPLGNYYCGWCTVLGFVLPENGVIVGKMPDFCQGCDLLFATGVL